MTVSSITRPVARFFQGVLEVPGCVPSFPLFSLLVALPVAILLAACGNDAQPAWDANALLDTGVILDTDDVRASIGSSTETAPAPPTLTTSISSYSLEITITVVAAPGPVFAQSIQRRVNGGAWRDVGEVRDSSTAVFTDRPPRGANVDYRGRTLRQSSAGVQTSLWSSTSSTTIVPLQGVPVVRAVDAEPDGDLDNDDLEAALATCYGLGGCNLVLEDATYAEVELKIGEHNDYNPATEPVYEQLARGFALVGQGAGKSILTGKVYPTDEKPRGTILLDAVPFDGWIFQGFTLQGRKRDQPAPRPGIDFGLNSGFLTAPPPGYNLPGYNTAPYIPNHNNTPRYQKRNLLIHDLEIRDYLGSGIAAMHVANPRVMDNVIENIGCHHACEAHPGPGGAWVCDVPFVGLPEQDAETLCGSNLGQAGLDGWNASFPTSNVPGTKASGFGIGFFGGIVGGLISGNVIKYATKQGIELYGPQIACDTDGVTVRGNEVHHSTTGFASNGSCNSTFIDNLAESSGLPGQGYTAALGRGFVCGARGENNRWLANTARFSNSSGYALGCWGEDDDDDGSYVANVLMDGNRSAANCMGISAGQGGADLAMGNNVSTRGFTITNHTIEHVSRCEAGMGVNYLQDVTVSSLDIDASRHSSILAGAEVFNRVVSLDRVTDSTFTVDLQIADYDIAQGGRYDFSSQTLRNVSVTLNVVSTAGGSLRQDYTTINGSAKGQNVRHNGVVVP